MQHAGAPLPVSYTSMGDTLVLQGRGGDRPWVRLIGVGTSVSLDANKPEAFYGKEVPEVLEAWTRGISLTLVDDPGVPLISGERRRAYAHRSPDGLDIGLGRSNMASPTHAEIMNTSDRPLTSPPRNGPEMLAVDTGSSRFLSPSRKPRFPVHHQHRLNPPDPPRSRSTPTLNSIVSSISGPARQRRPRPQNNGPRSTPQPSVDNFGSPMLGLPMFGPAMGGGSVFVNGYMRSNGTYVQPYYRMCT